MLNTGNNGTGMYMPVAPAYGYGGNNGGLGGDFGWMFLWIIAMMCGWGGFGGMGGGMWPMMMMGGGMGGFGMNMLYPWLDNSQNINNGFRDQAISNKLDNLGTAVTTGFGNVQLGQAGTNQAICQGVGAITGAVRDAAADAEIAANGRAMANMQQMFGLQAGVSQLENTVIRENCDDRAALAQGLQNQTMQGYQNTNAIVTEMRNGFQSLRNEFFADRLDAERRENAKLAADNAYLRNQADRVAMTAQIVDQTYNRFRDCPIDSVPVFGRQPIWSCTSNVAGNPGCGCPNNGNGYYG